MKLGGSDILGLAVSDRGISVHRTSDLGLVTEQGLPGYDPDDWYWWW